jgi:hypothetical protein
MIKVPFYQIRYYLREPSIANYLKLERGMTALTVMGNHTIEL